MAQEAEDRLAQLLMDDDLSDARLAGEEELTETGEEQHRHFKLRSELAALSSEATTAGVGGHGFGGQSEKGGLSGDGAEDMATSYQPTLDPWEAERLEQARSVAR